LLEVDAGYQMFIDSHCHIDFPDFSEGVMPLLANMQSGAG
jgi:Tat protein secretion system quality control protein TatD with DNase activity